MASLPFTFECWECEHAHAFMEGNYVVEKNDPPRRARDTKFYCIPCAEKVFGKEMVDRVLAGA